MICNVCGEDRRCYTLFECDFRGPMTAKFAGLMFHICTGCLTKLVDKIKTDKTVFEDETDMEVKDFRRKLKLMNAKNRNKVDDK